MSTSKVILDAECPGMLETVGESEMDQGEMADESLLRIPSIPKDQITPNFKAYIKRVHSQFSKDCPSNTALLTKLQNEWRKPIDDASHTNGSQSDENFENDSDNEMY